MALAASLADWTRPDTTTFRHWGQQEVNNAAELVGTFMYPKDIYKDASSISPSTELRSAIRTLKENNRLELVYRDFIGGFRLLEARPGLLKTFADPLSDNVNACFNLVTRDMARWTNQLTTNAALAVVPDTHKIMSGMIDNIAVWQMTWVAPVKHLENHKFTLDFFNVFQTLVHSNLPADFPDKFRDFLTASLTSLPSHLMEPPAEERNFPEIPVNPQKLPPPSKRLNRTGLIQRYTSTLTAVAFERIEEIAKEEAAKGWDTRRLTRARQRVGDGVANWLASIYDNADSSQMRPLFSRFDYHLCKTFFDVRTDELFDIIVEYPESMGALEDLKECLYKVDQRSVLVDKLRAANVKRLLHPGAETKMVITLYISTIRCLRILDPPGVLLHKVAEPIRQHLRKRTDTVKCVVAALVEGEELQDENEVGGLIQANHDETVEDFMDPKWEPEPVDAAPQFRSGKAGDLVSTLVSIYDNREIIVKELQVLLAQRLLAVKDYDAVKEIRIIELLKLRFGEATLQVCDVMLKDMADSKRIDDRVQGDAKSVVHPLVISRMFWPGIPASSLHLTPKLEKLQHEYETAFHHFKPDKRLRWMQHMGTATVKLELEDRTVEVEATPVQAAIGELFETQAAWDVATMSERLGVDFVQVRNGLAFWAKEGVVVEEDGLWRLLETLEGGETPTGERGCQNVSEAASAPN